MIAGVSVNRGTVLLAIAIAVLAYALVQLLADHADPRLTSASNTAPVASDSLDGADSPEDPAPNLNDEFRPLRRAALEVLAGAAALTLLLIGLVWLKGRYNY